MTPWGKIYIWDVRKKQKGEVGNQKSEEGGQAASGGAANISYVDNWAWESPK